MQRHERGVRVAGEDTIARLQDGRERREIAAVERPVGVRAELLVSFVEAIDRQEERFRIPDVHRDRQPETPAGIPHRIETRIVHLHQRAIRAAVPQIQAKRLEDLQAHRARGLRFRDLLGLPAGVAGLARARPGGLGHRDEPARERAIEAPDRGREIVAPSAGEVDHRAQVDRVHHADQIRRRHAAACRPGPRRYVAVKVDHREPRAIDVRFAHVQHALRLELRERQRRRACTGRLLRPFRTRPRAPAQCGADVPVPAADSHPRRVNENLRLSLIIIAVRRERT